MRCQFRMLLPNSFVSSLYVQLHGDLAPILDFCDNVNPNAKRPGSIKPGRQISVVAGARSQRFRTQVSAFLTIPP